MQPETNAKTQCAFETTSWALRIRLLHDALRGPDSRVPIVPVLLQPSQHRGTATLSCPWKGARGRGSNSLATP